MTFNNIIDKLKQRKTNLITSQDLIQWLSDNVKVLTYIPITTKYYIASLIKNQYKNSVNFGDAEDFNIEYYNLQYDIISTFYILMSYVNIVVPSDKMTPENYDLLMSTDFYGYIMCYASDDYRDFVSKCEKLTGIRNLEIINQFITEIGNRFNITNIQDIRKEINKIDMRKLGLLESIVKFNDKSKVDIMEAIDSAAKKEAMSKDVPQT